ncbi:MAG: hypothetical protein HGA82_02220 [Anaerolineales bacterium]|nr:hypothetical protein [Anaerolineales bacterium]
MKKIINSIIVISIAALLLSACGTAAPQSDPGGLKVLASTFRHAAWLNPKCPSLWGYGSTRQMIGQIFPMFPLNLLGLEKAVAHLGSC